jgi:hypothetical protein
MKTIKTNEFQIPENFHSKTAKAELLAALEHAIAQTHNDDQLATLRNKFAKAKGTKCIIVRRKAVA